VEGAGAHPGVDRGLAAAAGGDQKTEDQAGERKPET